MFVPIHLTPDGSTFRILFFPKRSKYKALSGSFFTARVRRAGRNMREEPSWRPGGDKSPSCLCQYLWLSTSWTECSIEISVSDFSLLLLFVRLGERAIMLSTRQWSMEVSIFVLFTCMTLIPDLSSLDLAGLAAVKPTIGLFEDPIRGLQAKIIFFSPLLFHNYFPFGALN